MSYLEEENLLLQNKNGQLKNTNEELTNNLNDDDNDGVINYFDEEENTEAGAKVNSKGVNLRYVDSDNDGINDLKDKCPKMKC